MLPGTDLLYQALKSNNNKQTCSSLFCRGLDVFRINPGVIICPELLLGLSAACVLGGVAVTTENNFLSGYERILFHVRGRCSGENDLHHHPRVLATTNTVSPTNTSDCLSGGETATVLPPRLVMTRVKMAQR